MRSRPLRFQRSWLSCRICWCDEVRQEAERVLREKLVDNVGLPMTLHDRCVEISRTLGFSLYQAVTESDVWLAPVEPPKECCRHLDH